MAAEKKELVEKMKILNAIQVLEWFLNSLICIGLFILHLLSNQVLYKLIINFHKIIL